MGKPRPQGGGKAPAKPGRSGGDTSASTKVKDPAKTSEASEAQRIADRNKADRTP
jgi:hypothetical protein